MGHPLLLVVLLCAPAHSVVARQRVASIPALPGPASVAGAVRPVTATLSPSPATPAPSLSALAFSGPSASLSPSPPASLPSKPAPALAAAGPAAARVAASAAAVSAVADYGALREDAPAEQGRSGADASFAALTGEHFSSRRDRSLPVVTFVPGNAAPDGVSAIVTLAAPAGAPAPGTPPVAPPPAPKKSDVKARAVTAAVIIPAQLLLIHLGGAVFAGFVVLLSFQMLRELGAMLEKGGRPVDRKAMTLAGTAAAASVALGLPAAAALALAGAGVLLREMTTTRSPDRAAWTFFGAAALGVLPVFLAPLRALPQGEALTLLVFAAAWAVDTGAYVAGKTLGRHKLAPLVSPGKTWEGSIGGLLAAGAVVAAFAWAVPGLLTLPQAAGVTLVIGVIGQVSGLSNSLIKRAMGVKDSGTLLPGHGGALDRFDTFVLTAALLFALLA